MKGKTAERTLNGQRRLLTETNKRTLSYKTEEEVGGKWEVGGGRKGSPPHARGQRQSARPRRRSGQGDGRT